MHHTPRDPRGLVLATLAAAAVAAGVAALVVMLPADASTGYDYPAEPVAAAPAGPSTAVPAAGAATSAGTALQSTSPPGSSPAGSGGAAGPVPAEPPAPKSNGGTVQAPAAAGAAQADTLRSTRVATRGRGRLMAATLTGDVEVPAKGDPRGVGVAAVRVEAGKLCLEGTVTGLAPVTRAHLHRGVRGTAGPVVAEFPVVGPARVAGCVRVDPALTARILTNPENWYVNVHTAAFPQGALRGQLMW